MIRAKARRAVESLADRGLSASTPGDHPCIERLQELRPNLIDRRAVRATRRKGIR
jgi:hypothetical protein